MSVDKRAVHTDALATLGTIIDESAKRDAIHIAVEPVVAGHWLRPGDDVGFLADGTVGSHAETLVGIVDPFLKKAVGKGDRFWLLVYPRQITSLRHVWAHPAFPEVVQELSSHTQKADSEAWLRKFIENSDCPGYETVIAKAVNNDSRDKDYLHFDNMDAHGAIPSEFWDHVEVVTGKMIPNYARASYFSCSC